MRQGIEQSGPSEATKGAEATSKAARRMGYKSGKKRLTDIGVKNLKAEKGYRVDVWDALLPAFGVRVSEGGTKAYMVMYRLKIDGKPKLRWLRLGDVNGLKLADARDAARAALAKAQRGIDPSIPEPGLDEAEGNGNTMRKAVAAYIEGYCRNNCRPATWREYERIFNREILPTLGNRSLASITPKDLRDVIGVVADRGKLVQANRVRATLSAFFNWAMGEPETWGVTASPMTNVRKAKKENKGRDRVLSDDEIRWFWQACDAIGGMFGPLFKVLLLTAQRRDEVGTMEWSEIDLAKGEWIIPRGKAKNDKAHIVALSPQAAKLLRDLKTQAEAIRDLTQSRFVFTTDGRTPVSGFSKAKTRLDSEMAKLAPRDIEAWRLHDLRRTAASGMAALKIPAEVVDKVLNHTAGAIRGVAAIYNRHEYLDERREALWKWAAHVENLTRPAADNVVTLEGRA